MRRQNTFHLFFRYENADDYLKKYFDQPVAKIFISGQMSKSARDTLSADYKIFQHPNYAEFGISGCDKATGIKYIESKYGLDRNKCVAIGDSLNDVDMLEYCGISVAVGNAEQKVKEICNIVTLPADCSGVGQAMLEITSLL